MKNEIITIFSDGGARGNPGPSAIGIVIDICGKIEQISEFIGSGTNNQAEYQAVIAGLEKLQDLDIIDQEINWFLDSELVVKQLNGEYKIKDIVLQEKVKMIQDLINKMNLKINFTHVTRDKNKQADKLVNQALDQHKSRNGYTFIEILISSLIFVSVIIVATAGFGQIVKYRAIVNANLDVNQVARTLSDQITSDIKNADVTTKINYPLKGVENEGVYSALTDSSQPQTSEFSSNTFLFIRSNIQPLNIFRICEDTLHFHCYNKFTLNEITTNEEKSFTLILVMGFKNGNGVKYKFYYFKNKPLVDNSFSVKYRELDKTTNELSTDEIIQSEGVDFIPSTKAKIGLFATQYFYQDYTTPSRFDLDFFITTPNYFSLTAKDYEKAWLTLHTVASVRDFK